MFGIGMPEMILILAVALIVIGPKKLPDLAKSLGKAMGEFKKATSDLKESMQIDSELKDLKSTFNDLEKEDEKPSKTATGEERTTSVDNTEPVKTADDEARQDNTEDPMDNLKAAFNRSDEDAVVTDTADSEAARKAAANEKMDTDPNRNPEPERPKDV